jgi:hypothetical protein
MVNQFVCLHLCIALNIGPENTIEIQPIVMTQIHYTIRRSSTILGHCFEVIAKSPFSIRYKFHDESRHNPAPIVQMPWKENSSGL